MTLKIACVVVSVLVWFQVASTTVVEADVSLPMRITGLGDEWTVEGNSLREMARVRLRAPKLALLANDYLGRPLGEVQMDLTNFEPGPTVLYVLKESDVRAEAEVITMLPPVRLPLLIDWQEERRLPVRVPLRGQLPQDRMLAAPIVTRPDTVLVSGPRRFFAGLDTVVTESVDLNDLEQTLDRDLPLTSIPVNLEVAVASVHVTVPVTAVDERIVANVPVVSEVPGAGISPPVCDVLVRGPADSVATLTPDQLRVTVPTAELGGGVQRATGLVQHPDWVIAVRLEPESFLVIMDEVEAPTPEGQR